MLRNIAFFLVFAVTTFSAHPTFAVPPTHLGVEADDIVTLLWGCNLPGKPTRLLNDGSRITDFSIPRGRVLVLTDFEWRGTTLQDSGIDENYIVEVHLSDSNGVPSVPYHAFIRIIQNRAYLSDHLTGGLGLDDTVTLDNDNSAPNPRLRLFSVVSTGPGTDCSAILRGYLLKTKGRKSSQSR